MTTIRTAANHSHRCPGWGYGRWQQTPRQRRQPDFSPDGVPGAGRCDRPAGGAIPGGTAIS